jgi:hypothetical protein
VILGKVDARTGDYISFQLLDGRHRLDAIEMIIGLPIRWLSRTKRRYNKNVTTYDLGFYNEKGEDVSLRKLNLVKPPKLEDYRRSPQELDFFTIIDDGPDVDPKAIVASLNAHRRHLSPKDKRAAIAGRLKANPDQSNRKIAEAVGADHKTVGATRADLESGGEIPHQERRTDKRGRGQPARKQPGKKTKATAKAKPNTMSAAIDDGKSAAALIAECLRRDVRDPEDIARETGVSRVEIYLTLRELARKVTEATGAPAGDTANCTTGTGEISLSDREQGSTDELARLRARNEELEHEVARLRTRVIGLESEVEELRAEIAGATDA